MSAKVQISIVTYNSGRHLKTCLESLRTQSYRDFAIYLFDNASRDSTFGTIEEYRWAIHSVLESDRNIGFCSAHNRLIDAASSEYVLVLNPDVILDARFLESLVREMDRHPRAGAATGKLYRWHGPGANVEPGLRLPEETELDSTGIYFTRNQRHFDRGSGEPGAGRYNRMEFVFGASGAAAFYRRSMLQDIRSGGQYFDESFFAYREDADLAWRAQWMGWRCLYVPDAKGWHERRVFPTGRASVPGVINMHSFKNRFLMRIKNMDAGTYARNLIPITVRDILAAGYVLIREWTSIPGFLYLAKAIPKALGARRSLKRRRRVAPRQIRQWFTGKTSEPL
jgi:GT2 family glycosyltransferase